MIFPINYVYAGSVQESSGVIVPTGSSSATVSSYQLSTSTLFPIVSSVTAIARVPPGGSAAPLQNDQNGLIATVGVLACLLMLAIVAMATLSVFISCNYKLWRSKGRHTVSGNSTAHDQPVGECYMHTPPNKVMSMFTHYTKLASLHQPGHAASPYTNAKSSHIVHTCRAS